MIPRGDMTLMIDRRLVGKIGRSTDHKHSGRSTTSNVPRVDVNIDRARLPHLACPALYVVLVPLEGDAVNDAGDRCGGRSREIQQAEHIDFSEQLNRSADVTLRMFQTHP